MGGLTTLGRRIETIMAISSEQETPKFLHVAAKAADCVNRFLKLDEEEKGLGTNCDALYNPNASRAELPARGKALLNIRRERLGDHIWNLGPNVRERYPI